MYSNMSPARPEVRLADVRRARARSSPWHGEPRRYALRHRDVTAAARHDCSSHACCMRRSAGGDPAAVFVVLMCSSTGVIGQQPAVCSTQDLASRMNAAENLCRPPQTTCDASCAAVLLSTFDECILDATTQARWAARHEVCADVAGHNTEPSRVSDQSWLRGDCRSDGTFACENGATCVLRSSHHRRRLQQGGKAGLCPLDLLPSRTDAVNAACCTALTDDCKNGLPVTCSAACAQVLVPYMDECAGALSDTVVNWQTLSSDLQSLLANCLPPAAPPAPSPAATLGPAYHRCTCPVGYTGTRCEAPSGKG